jgi:hypothetical protein
MNLLPPNSTWVQLELFPDRLPARASYGRHRLYSSPGEAWAYDRGYTDPIAIETSKAYLDGFYDREEERLDEAFPDPGCEWDD